MDFASDWVIDDVQRSLNSKLFPPTVAREAAATHSGLYLGWAIQCDLIGERLRREHAPGIAAFHQRHLTGPQFIIRLGGILRASYLNAELQAFSKTYYSTIGRFYPDYAYTFERHLAGASPPSMFAVPPTWESQSSLCEILDARLNAWRTYPQCAERIFGDEVGIDSYYGLETVTQVALLTVCRDLAGGRMCRPMVVFLTSSGEVRIPSLLSHRGRRITVMTDGGVAASVQCLREGLAIGTVVAFAAVFVNAADPSHNGIKVVAQHSRSGPHVVFAPYIKDTENRLRLGRPKKAACLVE